MTQTNFRGRFVWHELLTSDPKAAATFYTRALGWKAEPWDEDPSYTLFKSENGLVAGAMTLTAEAKAAGAKPHWLSYIGTPDLKGTVDSATRLGGKVLKNITPIPTVGRFAIIADPQGAVFAAFTPESAPPDKPPASDFAWHELITTNQVAAFRFYQELFGWEKTDAMEMPRLGTYQIFGLNGVGMGGTYNKGDDMPFPPHWLPYASVSDSPTVTRAVTNLGGKVMVGPMEVPGGGLISVCEDPQGVMFAMHSIATAAAHA
jgi:uncharacterized protein